MTRFITITQNMFRTYDEYLNHQERIRELFPTYYTCHECGYPVSDVEGVNEIFDETLDRNIQVCEDCCKDNPLKYPQRKLYQL